MRCFVIAQVLMLNVQFAFSQNDFKTMSFSGELDGLHFNAKIDYKPDCEHQTPFVRATLHSIEVVSFDYNGETYLGNTLIGISFPIKVTEANLDIVTDIEIAGRFGVTERYELKKGFLSTTMGGRGSAFMADEFRVTDEAVKKIKEALGVSGCTDLLNKTEYQNAYLGGNSLIGWVRIEGGDLRYTKPGDGKYDDVSLKDYLISLINKEKEEDESEEDEDETEDDDFWNGEDESEDEEVVEEAIEDDFWNGEDGNDENNNDDDFWSGDGSIEDAIELEKAKAMATGDQYIGHYESGTKYITVKCRDHGDVDGDRVKIYHNNDVVKSNLTLRSSYSSIDISLDEGVNRISFEALNNGDLGNNTATFVIEDSNGETLYSNSWKISTGYKGTLLIIKN